MGRIKNINAIKKLNEQMEKQILDYMESLRVQYEPQIIRLICGAVKPGQALLIHQWGAFVNDCDSPDSVWVNESKTDVLLQNALTDFEICTWDYIPYGIYTSEYYKDENGVITYM